MPERDKSLKKKNELIPAVFQVRDRLYGAWDGFYIMLSIPMMTVLKPGAFQYEEIQLKTCVSNEIK